MYKNTLKMNAKVVISRQRTTKFCSQILYVSIRDLYPVTDSEFQVLSNISYISIFKALES